MALTDCNLFRVTASTDCYVFFDNCVTCEPDSVSIPDGSIYYISHCTGNTSGITVVSGTSELVTSSPVVYNFLACCPTVGITELVSVLGDVSSFNLSLPKVYYFSGLTNVAVVTSEFPCEIEGCFELIGTGDTTTDYFYSCYERDESLAGSSCIECTGITHTGDTCFTALTGCCYDSFCLNTHYLPYSGYDGNYVSAGTYDGYSYYTGGTTPGYIYFFTGGSYWCLSTSLGGSCDLFGAFPCQSQCPDICDDIFDGNICPTPTPSPTVNCSLNDFTALFDCDVLPTPTPTPTVTSTSTPTPTPTPTVNPCSFKSATINVVPPSPTPTQTQTPSITPTRLANLCLVSGDSTYNTLSGFIICPGESLLFRDCKNILDIFITPEFVSPYSFNVGDIIASYVNGNSSIQRCLEFVGSTGSTPTDTIQVVSVYPSGSTACNDCRSSVPSPTPTSTLTPTPTLTPTNTPTPSSPGGEIFYIYTSCVKQVDGSRKFVVQTINVNTNLAQFSGFGFFPYDPLNPPTNQDWECWEYAGSILVLGNQNVSTVSYAFINSLYTNGTNLISVIQTGNWFTDIPVNNQNLFDFNLNNNNQGYTSSQSDPLTPPVAVSSCRLCQSNQAVRDIFVYQRCSDNLVIHQYIEVVPLGFTLSVGDVFRAIDPVTNLSSCWTYLGTYTGQITVDHIPDTNAPFYTNSGYSIISNINWPDIFSPPIFIGQPYTFQFDPNTNLPYTKCVFCE